MNKRVHEIAKERGLQTKEVLALLNAAGVQAKSASSSVDEATAQRVLGNGDTPSAAPEQPRRQAAKSTAADKASGEEASSGKAVADKPAGDKASGDKAPGDK